MRNLMLILLVSACFELDAAETLDQSRAHVSAVRENSHFDQFIVKYSDDSTERIDKNVVQAHLNAVSQSVGYGVAHVRTLGTGADLIQLGVPQDRNGSLELMAAILRNPNVVYVEPNAIQTPEYVPDDTHYDDQWHYFTPSEDEAGAMNVEDAWDLVTGSGVRVAVIDTGVTDHADIANNLVGGYDLIASPTRARDGGARDSDPADEGNWVNAGDCGPNDPPQNRNSSWHGTHVIGTVAALTDNAQGVAGVAHGAKVVPIRALGRCGGTIADIADAIVWASGSAVSGVPTNY